MSDRKASLFLALVAENAELRQQLSEAQDVLVETAIDAGRLHSQIEALQKELAALREGRGPRDRDACLPSGSDHHGRNWPSVAAE